MAAADGAENNLAQLIQAAIRDAVYPDDKISGADEKISGADEKISAGDKSVESSAAVST